MMKFILFEVLPLVIFGIRCINIFDNKIFNMICLGIFLILPIYLVIVNFYYSCKGLKSLALDIAIILFSVILLFPFEPDVPGQIYFFLVAIPSVFIMIALAVINHKQVISTIKITIRKIYKNKIHILSVGIIVVAIYFLMAKNTDSVVKDFYETLNGNDVNAGLELYGLSKLDENLKIENAKVTKIFTLHNYTYGIILIQYSCDVINKKNNETLSIKSNSVLSIKKDEGKWIVTNVNDKNIKSIRKILENNR